MVWLLVCLAVGVLAGVLYLIGIVGYCFWLTWRVPYQMRSRHEQVKRAIFSTPRRTR